MGSQLADVQPAGTAYGALAVFIVVVVVLLTILIVIGLLIRRARHNARRVSVSTYPAPGPQGSPGPPAWPVAATPSPAPPAGPPTGSPPPARPAGPPGGPWPGTTS